MLRHTIDSPRTTRRRDWFRIAFSLGHTSATARVEFICVQMNTKAQREQRATRTRRFFLGPLSSGRARSNQRSIVRAPRRRIRGARLKAAKKKRRKAQKKGPRDAQIQSNLVRRFFSSIPAGSLNKRERLQCFITRRGFLPEWAGNRGRRRGAHRLRSKLGVVLPASAHSSINLAGAPELPFCARHSHFAPTRHGGG